MEDQGQRSKGQRVKDKRSNVQQHMPGCSKNRIEVEFIPFTVWGRFFLPCIGFSGEILPCASIAENLAGERQISLEK